MGLTSSTRTALDALKAASGDNRKLIEDYDTTVAAAQAKLAREAGLTHQGRVDRLNKVRDTAAQTLETGLAALRDRVDADHATVSENLTRSWPKPAAGLEAMMARQAAWSRCRALLDAKAIRPKALLAETTDLETLHALREELPTWQRVVRGDDLPGMLVTSREIDQRLAEVAGKPNVLDAFQAAIEADAIRAGLEPMLDYTAKQTRDRGQIRSGSDRLAAAFEGAFAAKAAWAGEQLPGDPLSEVNRILGYGP